MLMTYNEKTNSAFDGITSHFLLSNNQQEGKKSAKGRRCISLAARKHAEPPLSALSNPRDFEDKAMQKIQRTVDKEEK
jgi:hypothetical protein